MSAQARRPYGLWESPLTPAGMAGALRLDEVAFDSDGWTLVWLEGRSGQGVLVGTVEGEAGRDLTAEESVRARVGYGGGDFTVGGGVAYFAGPGGRLYRLALAGGRAQAITPAFGQASSPRLSPDGRWVLYIHSDEGVDSVAVVEAGGGQWPSRLTVGHDFYMWPRWSPTGRHIAYVAWDHPAMPWDETELFLAPIAGTGPSGPILGESARLAGGERVAVNQPEFSPDGAKLAYIADASGWNQLYVYDLATGEHRPVTRAEAEHGGPAWGYEERAYAWGHDGRSLIYRRDERGFQQLWTVDIVTGENRPLAGDLAEYSSFSAIAASPTEASVAVVASSPVTPPRLLRAALAGGRAQIVRRSSGERIPATELAQPEPLTWRSGDGAEIYGLYYPPASARFAAEGPAPLVVQVHGGPTGHERAGYSDRVQFLATRGYGVLAVNYRGSTGHGRAYMDALRGNWGIHDVEDCVAGARHLVAAGRAQAERLVIMGGSAGGYTVLQALIDHPEFFKAGVCLYGVADHFALAAETHKFEARYLDGLLGPLPETAEVYRQRSPLFHADRIARPLAVFQGEEDKVVPKAQSEAIVASLRRRGVPHEYHLYPGEGHGWRKRETIESFYGALDAFLRRYVIYA